MLASRQSTLKSEGSPPRSSQGKPITLAGRKRRLQKMGPSLRQLRMRITCDDPMYRGLKKIKFSGKELVNLPPNLFSLTELEVLDLSPEREACLFYHLVEIPAEIGGLSNLKILALDTNKLTSLPDELCQLSILQRLAISNNHLTQLPSSFPSLVGLRSLYCSNNKFEELPVAVCQLKNLTFLDFSGNLITHIPEEIGSMDSLECLVLSYNRIESLPDSICNLRTLQMLWLSGNCLRELPRGFERLVNLDWSYLMLSAALDDNPLEHPPLSVAKQGPAAIEKYLGLHQSNKNSHDKPTKGLRTQR